MRLDSRVLLLDRARRALGGSIEDMSLEEIQRSRVTRLPHVPGLDPVVQRLGLALFGHPRRDVAIETRTVGGAAGELAARVHRPPGVAADAPLVVWFHGGGWVLGGPAQYDWACSSIAEDAGALVVAVDYRKAPEHRAPAATEDAIAATRWIADHAAELGATGPLVVAGDSAGGNLAALVAIAARDAGDLDVAGQALVYPGVDLTTSFPSIRELADAPILTREDIDAFRGHYLADEVDPADPRVSPWFVDDLAGVAPALVQTAEHDPLRDEGTAYADRLAAAGVSTRHTRYVGVPHGFLSLPGICPAAHQALAELVTFVSGC